MRWFRKPEYSGKTIPLSTGIVRIKVLTNGIVNSVLSQSCIVSGFQNKYFMLQLFEYALVDLSKKQIDNLSVKDGQKVRKVIKNILFEHEILEEDITQELNNDEPTNIHKEADVTWFNQQKSGAAARIASSINKV